VIPLSRKSQINSGNKDNKVKIKFIPKVLREIRLHPLLFIFAKLFTLTSFSFLEQGCCCCSMLKLVSGGNELFEEASISKKERVKS
jgi:hypothetical protein